MFVEFFIHLTDFREVGPMCLGQFVYTQCQYLPETVPVDTLTFSPKCSVANFS